MSSSVESRVNKSFVWRASPLNHVQGASWKSLVKFCKRVLFGGVKLSPSYPGSVVVDKVATD